MTRHTADTLRANLFLGPARQTVEWAERELTDARAAVRQSADRVGLPRDGIFSETKYVPRTTAHRWYKDGHAEGRGQGIDEIAGALKPPAQGDAFYDTWVHLQRFGVPQVDRILRDGDHDHVADRQSAEVVQLQDAIRKRSQPDLSGNARIGAPTTPGRLADAILAAGERARSDGADERPATKNPLAQAILDAARKAHTRDDQ
jgi:hypothetical protein